MISTSFSKGKCHDFRLFKESKTPIHPKTTVLADSGDPGLQKIHKKTKLPKKRTKKNPLTAEEKKHNQSLASQRAA